MLTKKDYEKLEEKFVTREYLDVVIKQLIEFIGDIKHEIITELGSKLDATTSELKSISLLHKTRLENHEERIQYLEVINKA